MRNLIPYKDTNAAPGSELHKLLTEGKVKEAERCYQEASARAKDIMTRYDRLESKQCLNK